MPSRRSTSRRNNCTRRPSRTYVLCPEQSQITTTLDHCTRRRRAHRSCLPVLPTVSSSSSSRRLPTTPTSLCIVPCYPTVVRPCMLPRHRCITVTVTACSSNSSNRSISTTTCSLPRRPTHRRLRRSAASAMLAWDWRTLAASARTNAAHLQVQLSISRARSCNSSLHPSRLPRRGPRSRTLGWARSTRTISSCRGTSAAADRHPRPRPSRVGRRPLRRLVSAALVRAIPCGQAR